MRWLLTSIAFVSLSSAALAAPVVDQNTGTWDDTFKDNAGLSKDAAQTFGIKQDPFAQLVTLAADATTGQFTTLPFTPVSFDQWRTVYMDYTASELADLKAWFKAPDGTLTALTFAPSDDPAFKVMASLAAIPVSATSGQLVVKLDEHFVQRGVLDTDPNRPADDPADVHIKPAVLAMRATWRPRSVVRVAVDAPASSCAGAAINYKARAAVSLVAAKDVVVVATVNAPPANQFGLRYLPTIGSISNGGFVQASDTTINGVAIPAGSVVWRLGDVGSGTTFQLSFTAYAPTGTLNNTLYTIGGAAGATNANPSVAPGSPAAGATVITSSVSPFAYKYPLNTFFINGRNYINGGKSLGYRLYIGNHEYYGGTCGENYHKAVVWDDVSNLVSGATGGGAVFEGDPTNGAFTISDGGKYTATAITVNGVAVPAKSIYWDLDTLDVGERYNLTFYTTLKAETPTGPLEAEHNIANTVHVQSGFRANQAQASVDVRIHIPDTPNGMYAKGLRIRGQSGISAIDDLPYTTVGYGDPATFLLYAQNNGASALNKTVMIDMVPAGMTFSSAFLPPGTGTVRYNTTTGAATTPPDYTVSSGTFGASWTTTPPADASTVRWVAFVVDKLASPYFPESGVPQSVVGELTATVNLPADACPPLRIGNSGLFQTYAYTGVGATTQTPITGITAMVQNDEWLDVRPVTPAFVYPYSTVSGAGTQNSAGTTAFYVNLWNYQPGGAETDTALDVRATLSMPRLGINGVDQFLPFVGVDAPGGSVDYSQLPDRVIVTYPSIAPLASRSITVRVNVPRGFVSGSAFGLTANVAARDDVCGVVSFAGSASTTILGNPYLQVGKRVDLGVAAPGSRLGYTLTYVNSGDAVSTQSWVVDRVPAGTHFQVSEAVPNGGQVWFSSSLPPTLPSSLRSSSFEFTDAVVRANFRQGQALPNGNVLPPSTVPDPVWVAFLVDNATVSPAQLPIGNPSSVRYFVTIADEAQNGDIVRNESAIFATNLLQAISNETLTYVSGDPSIEVAQSCPDVVANGEAFTVELDYVNNSTNNDYETVIQIALGKDVVFDSATHAWNTAALAAYGAIDVPASYDAQTGIVSFRVTHAIDATDTWPLRSFEGGHIVLHLHVKDGIASGTFEDIGALALASNAAPGQATVQTSVATGCRVVIENPDLFARKSVDIAAPVAGETITYSLIVSNEGAHDAKNVVIRDDLPAGLSYVTGSAFVTTAGWSLGGHNEPTLTNGGRTLSWTNSIQKGAGVLGTMPGRSGDVVITFRAKVADTVPPATTLVNTVTASHNDGFDDEDDTNNTGSVTVKTPLPDPWVVKSGKVIAQPGEVVTYRLRYGNASRQATGPVFVADKLYDGPVADGAADVSFVGATAANGETVYFNSAPLNAAMPAFVPATPTANGWRTTAAGGAVNWIGFARSSLAGDSGPYSIYVDLALRTPASGLTPLPGTTLTNLASVQLVGPNAPADEDPTNNTSSVDTKTPGIDIGAAIACTPDGAYPGTVPGGDASVRFELSNNGTVAAYGLRIRYTAGGWFVVGGDDATTAAVTTANGAAGGVVDAAGAPINGGVTWTRSGTDWVLGSLSETSAQYYRKVGLPAGAKVAITVTGKVAGDVPNDTEVAQAVQVITDYRFDFRPGVDQTEELTTNNGATCGTVIYRADPLVVKTASPVGAAASPYTSGDRVAFDIAFNNAGGAPADETVIDDFFPDGLDFVVGSVTNVPAGATLSYDDGSGAYTYVPEGRSGTIDPAVRALRVAFDEALPAPAGATFAQDSALDWKRGKFTNTTVPTGKDSVTVSGATGAHDGVYLSPVIPASDEGTVVEWARIIVDRATTGDGEVSVDILDGDTGEVLMTDVALDEGGALRISDVDAVAHRHIQLRARFSGALLACDPRNVIDYQLPTPYPQPVGEAAFGCDESGIAFGVDVPPDISYLPPVAWVPDGKGGYEHVTLPELPGSVLSEPIFSIAPGVIFGLVSTRQGPGYAAWSRDAEGAWTVARVVSTPYFGFGNLAFDRENQIIAGNLGKPVALYFDGTAWASLSLPIADGSSVSVVQARAGIITGQSYNNGPTSVVVWSPGALGYERADLPGLPDKTSYYAYANGIDASGLNVAGTIDSQPVVWQHRQAGWVTIPLPFDGFQNGQVLDIFGNGDVVGWGTTSDGSQNRPIVWHHEADGSYTREIPALPATDGTEPIQFNGQGMLLWNGSAFAFMARTTEAGYVRVVIWTRDGATFKPQVVALPASLTHVTNADVLTNGRDRFLLRYYSTDYRNASTAVIVLEEGVARTVDLETEYAWNYIQDFGLSRRSDPAGSGGCDDLIGYSTNNNRNYVASRWVIPATGETAPQQLLPQSPVQIMPSDAHAVVHDTVAGYSYDYDGAARPTLWPAGTGSDHPYVLPLPEGVTSVNIAAVSPDGSAAIGTDYQDSVVLTWTYDSETDAYVMHVAPGAGDPDGHGYVYDSFSWTHIAAVGGQSLDAGGTYVGGGWVWAPGTETGWAWVGSLLPDGMIMNRLDAGGDELSTVIAVEVETSVQHAYVIDSRDNPPSLVELRGPEHESPQQLTIVAAGPGGVFAGYDSSAEPNEALIWSPDGEGGYSVAAPLAGSKGSGVVAIAQKPFGETSYGLVLLRDYGTNQNVLMVPSSDGSYAPAEFLTEGTVRVFDDRFVPQPSMDYDRSGFYFGIVTGSLDLPGDELGDRPVFLFPQADGKFAPVAFGIPEGMNPTGGGITAIGMGPGSRWPVAFGYVQTTDETQGTTIHNVGWWFPGGDLTQEAVGVEIMPGMSGKQSGQVSGPADTYGSSTLWYLYEQETRYPTYVLVVATEDGFEPVTVANQGDFAAREMQLDPRTSFILSWTSLNESGRGGRLYGCNLNGGAELERWQVVYRTDRNPSFGYQLQVPQVCTAGYVNTASISTTSAQITTANDTSSVAVPVVSADLVTTVSADRGVVVYGDTVTYTAKVTNKGPGTAKNVELALRVPSGDGQGGYTSTKNAARLAPGESLTIVEGVYVSTSESFVTLVGSATATTSSIDCNNANDEGAATVVTGNLPNVYIALDGPESVPVGQSVELVATIGNNGNAPADAVVATIALPTGTVVTEVGDERCHIAGASVVCDFGSLQVDGEVGPIQVPIVIAPASCEAIGSSLPASAVVTSDFDVNDTDNTAGLVVERVSPDARLELDGFAGLGTVEKGQVVTWFVHYVNGGSADVESATLTADIPAGTTLVPGALPAGFAAASGKVTGVVGPLAPGAEGVLAFATTVTASSGALGGSATLVADAGACPVSAAYSGATVVPTGVAIVKQASLGASCAEAIDWVITVRNDGALPVANLVVTDTVPAGSPYVNGSIRGLGGAAAGAPVLTWSLGALRPGQSVTLGYRTQAPAASGDLVTNVATLSSGETVVARSEVVPVRADCRTPLGVTKAWEAGCATPGATTAVVVTAKNNGLTPLTNVVLRDRIDAGLTLVAEAGAAWTYDNTTRFVSMVVPTLGAGQSARLAYSVRVTGAAGAFVLNHATAQADQGEPMASNQVVGVIQDCDDRDPCTVDSCQMFVGCVNTLTPKPGVDETCNGADDDCDGRLDAADEDLVIDLCEKQASVCEGSEHTAAECVGGTWKACTDVDYANHSELYTTTDPSCDGVDNDCGGGTDEDYVGHTVTCGEGDCQGSTVTTCVQGDVQSDCRPKADGVACDDGDACSVASQCKDGSCRATSYRSCDDHNACTTDSCDPIEGCVFEPGEDGVACDDGNECTTGDACLAGECAGDEVPCAEPDACHFAGECNPATGVCEYGVRPGDLPVPIGLTDLGTLGGPSSAALAVGGGLVVGAADTENGERHAFAWTAEGGMVDLTPGEGIASEATGVDDHGLVVGVKTVGGVTSAFSWDAGQAVTLFSGAEAHVLAPRGGHVAGSAAGNGYYSATGRAAAIAIVPPAGGSAVEPTALNDAGVVVGHATIGGKTQAFRWTTGTATALASGEGSDALAVDAAGDAAGWSMVSGERHATLFPMTGVAVDLGTLGGASSWATAMGDGVVIGQSATASGGAHAFAWTEASGMVDLGALPGGESDALFLADSGLIAGTTTTSFGTQQAALWSALPDGALTALELLGGTSAAPVGLTDAGLVAGNIETATGSRAFVWESRRGTEDLGTFGGVTATAAAVSGEGQVVGAAATAKGDLHAFISSVPETACIVCDVDDTPPVITCPVFRKPVECSADGAAIHLGKPSVSDACGRPVTVTSDEPETYAPGQTVVTFTATDSEGNAASCTTTVVVEDTEAPTITCPETVTLQSPDGVCGATGTLTATAADGCDGSEVTVIGPAGDISQPVTFGPGETTVTLTAVDRAGNQATCQTLVKVEGVRPLTIDCEPEMTVDAPADFCGYPEAIPADVLDVCANDLTVQSSSDEFPIGVTDVLFEAQNGRGDTATCTTKLTVRDVTKPVVTCGIPEGDLLAPPSVFTPVVTDACTATWTVSDARCVAVDAGGGETVLTDGCELIIRDGIAVAVKAVPIWDAAGKVVAPDALHVRWTVTGTDPSGNSETAACDTLLDLSARDRDQDGIPDVTDNCPDTKNADQSDLDLDGIGDACEDSPYDGMTAEGSGGCQGGSPLPLGLALAALGLIVARRARAARSR